MQASQSSSSEEIRGSVMDQRKRKRMLSNRESARRSRMRKQQHLDELINQVEHLKNENSQIETQADLLNQQFLIVDSENCALRSEVMDLTERLRSMNSVLEFVGEFSGMMMDIQEIPDPLLKPWQLPCPTQPVMFQY
ncbi:bZIP transcription factor 53-like [Dioscorea cayenensis subsp. rotundata]|uniref:BZIP transcription factor 53-like n=1 Tax=Dioscorea cayennensis subsp. rotundata TaxID=55577 RepID=A0AB40AID1_DIOCR|nr:bZIP transcription factor 53-like [Dioscorea cayenensis subsp. rotundata]